MATPLPIRPLFQGPFWVSPNGSDTVGDGTAGNPWRQPQKAIDFIRTNRLNEVQSADIVVNVRQGSYSPFTLGTLDSGYNGHNVHYVSYDGPGLAVVDAGTQITNWTNVSGNIFKASVPNLFFTMYENGIRSRLCRLPKYSAQSSYPVSKGPYFTTQSDSDQLTRLIYSSSDFDPTGWSAADLSVFEWTGGGWCWFSDTTPVASIDTVNKILNYTQQAKFNVFGDASFQSGIGSRYFVQGIQAMQSAAGEWYLDRNAGELYYIARDGAIGNQVITIPSASEGITLSGTSFAERVSSVIIDGFKVQNTDHVQWYRPGWPLPTPGTVNGPVPSPWLLSGAQIYAWFACMPQNLLGAVHLRNTDNCQVTNCNVTAAGMYGVLLDGYGQNNQVTTDWIHGTALAGVRAEGQFPGLGDILRNNLYQNLRIHDVGELSSQGNIQLSQSGNSTIRNCELYNSPRQGIWISGANEVDPVYQMYCGNSLIDHVLVHDVCQDSRDAGGIGLDSYSSVFPNVYLPITINQSIVHAVHCDPTAPASTDVHGLYFDDHTDGSIASDVYVYDVSGNLLNVNDSGHHSATNCSFNADGTVNSGFDLSKIDVANIGTTSSFPF